MMGERGDAVPAEIGGELGIGERFLLLADRQDMDLARLDKEG